MYVSKMTKMNVHTTNRNILFIWYLNGQYAKMKETVWWMNMIVSVINTYSYW